MMLPAKEPHMNQDGMLKEPGLEDCSPAGNPNPLKSKKLIQAPSRKLIQQHQGALPNRKMTKFKSNFQNTSLDSVASKNEKEMTSSLQF